MLRVKHAPVRRAADSRALIWFELHVVVKARLVARTFGMRVLRRRANLFERSGRL